VSEDNYTSIFLAEGLGFEIEWRSLSLAGVQITLISNEATETSQSIPMPRPFGIPPPKDRQERMGIETMTMTHCVCICHVYDRTALK